MKTITAIIEPPQPSVRDIKRWQAILLARTGLSRQAIAYRLGYKTAGLITHWVNQHTRTMQRLARERAARPNP